MLLGRKKEKNQNRFHAFRFGQWDKTDNFITIVKSKVIYYMSITISLYMNMTPNHAIENNHFIIFGN